MALQDGAQFSVTVTNGAGSLDADDVAARSLMAELAAIPRTTIRMAEGVPAPIGSKAVMMDQLATVVVGMSAAGAILPTIITAIRDWLLRQPPQTSIKIKDGDFEFDWSGATAPIAVTDLISRMIERQRAG